MDDFFELLEANDRFMSGAVLSYEGPGLRRYRNRQKNRAEYKVIGEISYQNVPFFPYFHSLAETKISLETTETYFPIPENASRITLAIAV